MVDIVLDGILVLCFYLIRQLGIFCGRSGYLPFSLEYFDADAGIDAGKFLDSIMPVFGAFFLRASSVYVCII